MALETSSEGTSEETGMTTIQEHLTSVWKMAEMTNPERETEEETKEECVAATVARRESEVMSSEGHVVTSGSQEMEGKLLILLQVNCRSIFNKILEFGNLIDTYNLDVIIGMESWLREETNNAEIFRDDYTTFRRDRCTRAGGVFICVKNYIECRELWVDEDFEMIAIEVKDKDTKFTWEIIGIYRAPNEDMRVLVRLAAQTAYAGNSTKRSINGGDLNLPYADWNGNAGCNSGTQAFINSLVWENWFTEVVDSPI